MANEFKYIINTELKLNTSSLNNLIEEAKAIDTRLKQAVQTGHMFELPVSLRLAPNAMESIQRQLGTLHATVELEIDRRAIEGVREQIRTMLSGTPVQVQAQAQATQAQSGGRSLRDRRAAMEGGATTSPAARSSEIRDRETLVRIEERLSRIRRNDAQTQERSFRIQRTMHMDAQRVTGGINRYRITDRRVLPMYEDRQLLEEWGQARRFYIQQRNTPTGASTTLNRNHPVRILDREMKERYNNQVKMYENMFKELDKIMTENPLSQKALTREPKYISDNYYRQIRERQMQELQYSQDWKDAQRLAQQQANTPMGAVSNLPKNHPVRVLDRQITAQRDLQTKLVDLSIPLSEKQALLKQYDEVFSQIAREAGASFTKSFKINHRNMDGTISELRTVTKEYRANGTVVDRSDQSFKSLMQTMGQNIVKYNMIAGGIRLVTQALMEGITYMAQYEQQYVRMSNITTTRNADIQRQYISGKDMPNGIATVNVNSAQKDVLSLASKYGLDPSGDVMPLYTELLKRKDIAPNQDDATRIAESIIRAGFVAKGSSNISGQDLMGISDDAVSIYAKMSKYWKGDSIGKWEDYTDYLAALSLRGSEIDKTMDATAGLAEYAGPGKLDLKRMSSLIAQEQLKMKDASGSELENLNKMFFANILDPDSKSAMAARRMIGIDVVNGEGKSTSLGEALDALAQKYNGLQGDTEKDNFSTEFARYLASSSGTGGRNLAHFKSIVQANAESYGIDEQLGDYKGSAEKVAKDYMSTLSGSFNQLIADIKILTKELGESGLLGIFKGLVDTVDVFVRALNSILGVWNSIGKFTESVTGINFTSLAGSIMSVVGSFKLLQMAITKLGFGSTAVGFVQGLLQRGSALPAQNRGAYIGNAVGETVGSFLGQRFGGARGSIRTVTTAAGNAVGRGASRVASVGSQMASGFIGGAENAAGGFFSRLAGGFGGLGKAAWTLMGVFGRLTVVTGLLIGALQLGKMAFDQGQAIHEDNIRRYNENWQTQNSSKGFRSQIDKLKELDALTNGGQRQDVSPETKKQYTDLQTDLEKRGISKIGSFEYAFSGTDANGKTFNRTFFSNSDESINKMFTEGQKKVQDTVKIAKSFQNALDYSNMLDGLNQINRKVEQVQNYTQTASSGNDFKFMGATDSASYYQAQMAVSQNALAQLSGSYEGLMADRKTIDAMTASKDQLLADVSKESVTPSAIRDEIDKKFQEARQAGQPISSVMSDYSDTSTQEGVAKNRYALAKLQAEMAADADKNVEDQLNKTTQAMVEQISKLKEMYSAYVQASAGVQLYEQALKGVRSDVQNAQNLLNAIQNPEQKVKQGSTVFGLMTKEVGTLRGELNSIDSKMAQIRANGEDYSMATLYNPNELGLSADQLAYKGLLEKRQEVNDTLQQAVSAQRDMQEQMVQLVMSTDKYKDMWESVQSRIQTIRDMSKEIRGLQNQEIVNASMNAIKSKLLGSTFDSKGEAKSQYEQLRDQHLSNVEKLQKARIDYGQDADKLKEAIDEINSSTRDQMKNAAIDPMRDLIRNDLNDVVQRQKDASDELKKGADFFDQSAQELLKKIQSIKISISSDGKTVSFGDGAASTSSTDTSSNSSYWDNANWDDPNVQKAYKRQLIKEDQSNDSAPVGNVLGGVLAGQESLFANIGNKYGIDPKLMMAIAMHETGNGTSQLAQSQNNIAGITDPNKGGFASYRTIGDGIDALGSLLQWYKSNGWGTSIPDIQKHYAPVGAGNDPNGLNNNWINGVSYFYSVVSGGKSGYTPPSAITPSTTTVNGLTDQANSAEEAARRQEELQRKSQLYEMQELFASFESQAKALLNNNPEFSVNSAIRDARVAYQVTGHKSELTLGTYDAYRQGQMDIARKLDDNNDYLRTLRNERDYRESASAGYYADAVKTGDYSLYHSNREGIDMFNKMIAELEKNNEQLGKLNQKYAEQAYNDPRYNGQSADKEIKGLLQSLTDKINTGQSGDPQYYQMLDDLQNMFSEYFNRDKALNARKFAYDQFGFDYEGYAKVKMIKAKEDLQLLFKQAYQVQDVLATLKKGSNDWFTVLEDAVAIQEKYVELENKKTELAQRWFELTGKDLPAYVNSRAYTQSRDTVQNMQNLKTSVGEYQTKGSTMDANEQLVALQIISETADKLEQQMNDYRNAVVGAFKAGAISIDEYLKRLYNLRDAQREAKEQAIGMMDSISSNFQQSLSQALQSGMQGSFDAPLEFMQNIKNGLASTVSSQMSNLILNNSGLKTVMDNLSKSMAEAMTKGNVNDSLNAFNDNNFGAQIDSALAPFLPLIQQISASTDGIFGIMKDQVFNAPSGFKIDDYLYNYTKDKTYSDLAPWLDGTIRNEAGSPIGQTDLGKINVPTLPAPTGLPSTVTTPIDPIRGGANIETKTRNPVKELIQNILRDQGVWDSKLGSSEQGNMMAHGNADNNRALLAQIAPEIAKAIGDGGNGLGGQALQDYLKNSDLSMYDMVEKTDGVNSSIIGMDEGVQAKLDTLNGTTSQVVSAVAAMHQANPNSTINTGVSGSAGKWTSGDIAAIKAIQDAGKDWQNAKTDAERQAAHDKAVQAGNAIGASFDPSTGQWSKNGSILNGSNTSGDVKGIINATNNSNAIAQSGFGSVTSGLGSVVGAVNGVAGAIGSMPAPVVNVSVSGGGSSYSSGGGTSSYSSNYGSTSTNQDKLAQMKANSAAWANATTDAQRQALSDANANLGTSMGYTRGDDGVWRDKTGKRVYHTGGIAGVGNFASAAGLMPSEIDALLQRHELVFQPAQLSDLIGGTVSRYADRGIGYGTPNSGTTRGDSGIQINVTVNGGGDKASITEAVEIAVKRSITEFQRITRQTNLQVRGVSY